MAIVKNWVVRITNTDKGVHSDMCFKTRKEARFHMKSAKSMVAASPMFRVDIYQTSTIGSGKTFMTHFTKAR